MVTTSLHEMLISAGAIRFGDFTLASGKKSRVYIDIKKAITESIILKKIASEILLKNCVFDAVAGVAVGGIPLAVAVSLASDKPYVIIRKEQKTHGIANLIIGEAEGKRILLVEDVTTSGGSAVFGIEQLRSAGAIVEDVITVVDRNEGAEKTLIKLDIRLTSLVSIKDLVNR